MLKLSNYLRTTAVIIISIVFFGQQLVGTAFAATSCSGGLSNLDCQSLINGWTQWVPDVCGQSGGTTSLTGSDSYQQIFNYFVSNGYSAAAAAGIVGNVHAESGGDPEKWEGDQKDYQTPPQPTNPKLGWGIVQWSPASEILNYGQYTGQPAYLLLTQVEFLLNQLNGTAPFNNNQGAGNALKQVTATTAHDAAYNSAVSFLLNFERDGNGPNSQDAQNRGTFADQAYALYASGSGGNTTIPNGCSSTGTGGTVPGCNFSNTGGAANNLYTTNTTIVYPNVAIMCQRAQLLAAGQLINVSAHPPRPFCANGSCVGKCDYVAGISWGYDSYTGYASAYVHWQTMEAQGHAHPGDRNPPVGALLFYQDPSTPGYPNQDFGHVVIYLGNNMVISSDISPTGQYSPGSISIVPAYKIEARGFGDPYLGWSDPVFAGPKDPNF